jgi:PPP family 3-phenylpropionic acid transporter
MLLQFMSVAVTGITTPFFNVFLVDMGMSATMIGTLLAVGSFLELVITPLLNGVADRQNRHRQLFLIYVTLFALGLLIYANTRIIWWLGVAVLLIQVSLRPSSTLAMQLTMTRMEQLGSAVIGRVRSFAALGYGLASLVATPLFNLGGYTILFFSGILLSALTVGVSGVLPTQTASDKEKTQTVKRNRGFYVLALSQFFVAMGIRAGYAFWLVHFTRNLGLSIANVGVFMAFVALIEVPFFALLDPLLKRWNPRIIYIIGSAGMGLFFLTMGMTTNIWFLIPLIAIRGLIWPMYNLTIFLLTSQISRPRNVATNQAIMNVTMPSIAVLLTGSASGWIFDNLGAFPFFALCAAVCLIGALIAAVGYRALKPIATV